MPTAGEYKHEPLGIPCHCYVRRRINNSLSQKSSLCKAKENLPINEQRKLPKRVTFDPVLRIRSYKNDFKCQDYQKPLQDSSKEQPLQQPLQPPQQRRPDSAANQQLDLGLVNDGMPSQAPQSSEPLANTSTSNNFDWSLCDKITSFFGFQKVITTTANSQLPTKSFEYGGISDSQYNPEDKSLVDENNNGAIRTSAKQIDFQRGDKEIYSNKGFPAGQARKFAGRPRKQTPPRKNRVSKIRERMAEGGGKRCSSSSWKYGNFAIRNPSSSERSSFQFTFKDAGNCVSAYQVSDQANCCGSHDCCCSPEFDQHTMPPLSTFQCPSVRVDGNAAASITASSSNSEDETAEKLDKYMHEAPDTSKNREYEDVPIKSAIRQQTESKNLDSSSTIPAFESDDYSYGFIKHETERDPTMEMSPERRYPCSHVLTSQSASDLQTIISSPYDDEFLNKYLKGCGKAGDNEPETDILAKVQMAEKTKKSLLNQMLEGMKGSVIDDIFKMTPVALFWTGCTFLIALIYIIIFSCAKDQDE